MNTENPKQHGDTELEINQSELRFNALSFLVSNFEKWPTDIKHNGISGRKFKTFRFVRSSDDDKIYFANCVVRGISEDEFLQAKVDFESINTLSA